MFQLCTIKTWDVIAQSYVLKNYDSVVTYTKKLIQKIRIIIRKTTTVQQHSDMHTIVQINKWKRQYFTKTCFKKKNQQKSHGKFLSKQ